MHFSASILWFFCFWCAPPQAEDHSGAPVWMAFPGRDRLRVRPPMLSWVSAARSEETGLHCWKEKGIWIADIHQPEEDFYLPHTSWKSLEVKLNRSSSNTSLILIFSSVAKLCLTLGNPMDFNLRGSFVHRIFQPGILEWVAISYSRASSRSCNTCIGRQSLPLNHQGSPFNFLKIFLFICCVGSFLK